MTPSSLASAVDVAKGESTVQLPSVPTLPLEAITFSRVGEGKTALRALYQGARDVIPPWIKAGRYTSLTWAAHMGGGRAA